MRPSVSGLRSPSAARLPEHGERERRRPSRIRSWLRRNDARQRRQPARVPSGQRHDARAATGRRATAGGGRRAGPPGAAPSPRAPRGAARAAGVEPVARVQRVPQRREAAPLRVRVQRVADRAAQPHAHPRHRVRVLGVDPEDEPARAGSPRRSGRASSRRRACRSTRSRRRSPRSSAPRSPTPRARAGPAGATRVQRRAQRLHQTEQRGAWWPTSWTSEDAIPWPTIRSRGTRMMATGFCPPPGSRVRARRIAAPGPRCEVADDRRLPRIPAPGRRSASAASTSRPASQTPVSSRCAG